MPRVLACGDNSFGSLLHNRDDLHLLTPVEIPGASSLVAASWSQTVITKAHADLELQGLASDSLKLSAPQLLGQDACVAWLRADGRVESLEGALSEGAFSHVAMNDRGELLGVSASSPISVTFYPSLSALLEPAPTSPPIVLTSPLLMPTSAVHSLIAGASHFLLLLSSPSHALLSYGDNRFTQLGVPSSTPSSPTHLHHVDVFEGLAPRAIAAGAFHSAVISEVGALYMFGKGSEGQCGGEGGGDPTLVELGDGEEEVRSVACGAEHTVVVTDRAVWVTGSNHAGQLGLGDINPRPSFVRHETLSRLLPVRQILCTRWGTLLEVD